MRARYLRDRDDLAGGSPTDRVARRHAACVAKLPGELRRAGQPCLYKPEIRTEQPAGVTAVPQAERPERVPVTRSHGYGLPDRIGRRAPASENNPYFAQGGRKLPRHRGVDQRRLHRTASEAPCPMLRTPPLLPVVR